MLLDKESLFSVREKIARFLDLTIMVRENAGTLLQTQHLGLLRRGDFSIIQTPITRDY